MARLDLGEMELATVEPEVASGETYFRLGLMYSTGGDAEPDRVAAHKWFNVAAARGYRDAVRYRQELAQEMAGDEVREALRQAREYLTVH